MTVDALNPDISINDVRDQTGFDLIVARDLPVTKPPTEAELRVLRDSTPTELLS